jgi:hypothetical protein
MRWTRLVARRRIAHDGTVHEAGAALTVEAAQAEALIACGAAEAVQPAEVAPDDAGETATSTQRRRR